MTFNPDERWELVVIVDEEPEVLVNIMREIANYTAETIGYEGRQRFEITAFDPTGDCIAEYAYDPEEEVNE